MTSYGRSRLSDRFLEDRAYLELVYPTKSNAPNIAAYSDKRVRIPFYETPIITESQSPRYATYKLIGRNSDLYSFLGSDSRQFTITFYLTLQHMQMFLKDSPWKSKEYTYNSIPKFDIVRADTADIMNPSFNAPQNASFAENLIDEAATKNAEDLLDKAIEDYHNQDGIRASNTMDAFEEEFTELTAESLGIDLLSIGNRNSGNTGLISQGLDWLNGFFDEPPKEGLMNVKAIIYYYTNLIRSTTLGSAKLGLGPPVVRLTFGPLYQDVPCLVSKYDISMENNAGYHLKTLMPHRIKVTLNMNEVRVGNFGKHEPMMFGPSDDNVPTWESVFSYGTIDPRTEPRLSRPTEEDFLTSKITDKAKQRDILGIPPA